MKPRFLIWILLMCLVIAGLVGFWSRPVPPRVGTARFLCLTNGNPWNSSLAGLGPVATFARGTPQEALLIRDWLNAGTNAAVFTVSNSLRRPISILPVARLATAGDKDGWGKHTPLLLSAGQGGGIDLGPGQAKMVQVALLAHEGSWRIQFCYLLVPEDSLLKTVFAKFNGTATHGSTGFIYSDWVNP